MGFMASPQQGISFIIAIFVCTTFAAVAVQYGQIVITETVAQQALRDLRQDIFIHLQVIPIQFYDRTPIGRIMTRLTTDVDALSEMLNSGMITIFTNVIMALYVMIWMLWINWLIAVVSLTTVAVIIVFIALFRTGSRHVFRTLRLRAAAINSFLQEHIAGMHVVQLFTREEKDFAAFRHINQEHWHTATHATFRNALFYSTLQTMTSVGIALVIWFGGNQTIRGRMSLGALVASIQLSQVLYEPIAEISAKYNIFQAAIASAETIFTLLDEPVVCGTTGTLSIAPVRGRLEFRNVWFAYKDNEWCLKDVSFTVEPGEKVAFVGHTGAGKTTIINLLLRFYDIQRGHILLDDVDIRSIGLEELRSSFSVVPQDVFLFAGDITSNIRLGSKAISRDQVKAAARDVYIDEFISGLSMGYDSEVLERGADLSAGQRQLIGFARALAFDRSILILDEATSSIDPVTDALVRDAVKRLMNGRTSLIIAHRLSTIQSVDRIIVIQKGEIREIGSHRALLARRGLYHKLYQLQFENNYPGTTAHKNAI